MEKKERIAEMQGYVDESYGVLGIKEVPYIVVDSYYKSINATANLKQNRIEVSNPALKLGEDSELYIQNLISHEIGHLIMQDAHARLPMVGKYKWQRVIDTMTELRADIIGVQLMGIRGYDLTKTTQGEFFRHICRDERENIKRNYPKSIERVGISYEYREGYLSNAMRESIGLYQKRYKIEDKAFKDHLYKKIKSLEREWIMSTGAKQRRELESYRWYYTWYKVLYEGEVTKWDEYYNGRYQKETEEARKQKLAGLVRKRVDVKW